MKRIIFSVLFLFLFMGLDHAQNFMLKVTPTISTATVAVDADSAKDTIKAHTAGGLKSVTVGMRVVGTSIPFGSYVVQVIDTTTVRISNKTTNAISNTGVQWGYFTSAAYAAGDALGFPLTIQPFRQIKEIIVEDDDKQITSVDMVFFDTTFTETKDTAAFSPSDADARRIVGYVTVGGTGFEKSLANNYVMVLPFTDMPLQFSVKKLYVQMICVGTPTFTTSSSLHITFIGE